jgi:predicted CXXCH cytochrome family protein
MSQTLRRLALLTLSVVGLAVLAGCVDEKIVFQRDLFEDPLAAAQNFLGYTDQATKLTVCGNCHVEKQGDWEGTAHADAWATLQANPGAQESCEGCHTVSQNGNLVDDLAGYTATGEDRYHDVQCESCHGPGLIHVQNPKDETVPLAPLQVAADPALGCAECHSGTHQPFVDEWTQSRHGEGALAPDLRNAFDDGHGGGCAPCHSAEAVLASWGVNTTYVDKGADQEIGITCAVCHDPHANDNDSQLRFAIDDPSVEDNLCMKCHHKRAIPDLGSGGTSTRGPHSPQGPLLLGVVGEVGWTPPNFAYNVERIRGTHGTERNARLCAGCHVNSHEVTDPESGDHVFSATGHLFKPVPCVDAQGVPQADDSCALTVEARDFGSCTASGCHGDEDAALSAMLLAQGRIAGLVADLEAMLDDVPADQFSSADTIFTVAEGAQFNAQLGAIESSAIHNPFMTEALLTSSITAVQDQYGVTPPPQLILENIIGTKGSVGN